MKTLHIFRKPTLIVLCILGITSCEKTEPDGEVVDQEVFMSTTGNSNDQSETIKLIFHMSFGVDYKNPF